jgi:hypothetical protein
MYFHHGSPYRYSDRQPMDINSTSPATPKALSYGNVFIATAAAGGNKRVRVLIHEPHLTANAIYDADEKEPSAIAVINLNIYNSTQPAP